jgi:hypothetical protein
MGESRHHATSGLYPAALAATGAATDRRTCRPSPRRDNAVMPTDLYFDLAETLRLAEHAIAAPENNPSYSEHLDGLACPGALEWVADWGTYLMSGGNPGLHTDPTDPNSSNVVVYAHGWGPDSDRRALAATGIGGDDFAEHLHLHETCEGSDRSLIDRLRQGAALGMRSLVLQVDADADTVTIWLSRTGPKVG